MKEKCTDSHEIQHDYVSYVDDHKAVVGGTAGPAMAGPLFWPKMVLAGPLFRPIMIFIIFFAR